LNALYGIITILFKQKDNIDNCIVKK
jgi:hypothetical protein